MFNVSPKKTLSSRASSISRWFVFKAWRQLLGRFYLLQPLHLSVEGVMHLGDILTSWGICVSEASIQARGDILGTCL